MRTASCGRALAFLSILALGGCLDRKLKPLSPCLVSNLVDQVKSSRIDKVDLLFMVDNSDSMKEEQASLKDQFPKLIRTLTTGDRDGDGVKEFEPAVDLHIGVVSSDLGFPGQSIDHCSDFGDDGILQNSPSADVSNCKASYPRYLSFVLGRDDPASTAQDFACIAQLGTGGCGFEQQLESPLKALWPSVDPSPDPVTHKNRVTFLADQSGHELGHGDRENAGFLRGDQDGSSLLAIVLVTDEDDCSSLKTNDVAGLGEDTNLRCFLHKDALYDTSRYVKAFQALRPASPDLVVFAAITGVPKDLVDADARAKVRFDEAASRDAYYKALLDDPRMQEVPSGPAMPGVTRELRPSCVSAHGNAAPPRRIVQVAQSFGANGIVQSVCQDDFGPAMDAVIDLISSKLGSVCLPRKLVRNAEGLVDCNVVWELPMNARPGTPTACGQPDFPFLLPADPDLLSLAPPGTELCKVAQLRVLDQIPASGGPAIKDTMPTTNSGQLFADGWYYDDFSKQRDQKCGPAGQRIAFTQRATPPNGVTVHLACLDERQTLAAQRTDTLVGLRQPSLGDACDVAEKNGAHTSSDAACEVHLSGASARFPDATDRSMFCHPKLNLCVRACRNDGDCPPAFVCDDRSETLSATASSARPGGQAICVNPTCGESR